MSDLYWQRDGKWWTHAERARKVSADTEDEIRAMIEARRGLPERFDGRVLPPFTDVIRAATLAIQHYDPSGDPFGCARTDVDSIVALRNRELTVHVKVGVALELPGAKAGKLGEVHLRMIVVGAVAHVDADSRYVYTDDRAVVDVACQAILRAVEGPAQEFAKAMKAGDGK